MTDVVVRLSKSFGLDEWIAEGDPAGSEWSGTEWGWLTRIRPARLNPGDRLYVVYKDRLIGYAPVTRVVPTSDPGLYAICRNHDAVACTIDEAIPSFRGIRYRWWDRSIEVPFPEWKALQ